MKLEPMLPRASLVSDAVERLEASIRRDLLPGARLPAETDIARQLGVSRPVVREALAFLRAEGLVETRRGQGLFVAEQAVLRIRAGDMTSSNARIAELLEFRRGLEGETVRMAAERGTETEIAEIKAALDAIDVAEAEGRDGVEEDLAFHLAIAKASHNSLHLKVMHFLSGTLRAAISDLRAFDSSTAAYVEDRSRRHAEIYRLIAARDAEGAHQAMFEHMSMSLARYRQK